MLFATLIMLTAVSVLSLNMFLPSLGFMATDFAVDYSTMTLAMSAYLVFTAILQLIIGPLADHYGRKPILIGALALFAIASVGCALAETFETFLLFRILQGAVVTGAALSRAIVSDLVEPGKAASIIGYMTMAMSLAPIMGPFFGGYLGEIYGWRSNFWLLTVAGLSLWILVWWKLPETIKRDNSASRFKWATYGELLQDKLFWAYSLIASFGVGGFYIFINGVPLIAVEHLGLSQSETGIGIGSITVGFLVGNFFSGRYSQSVGLNQMVLTGRLVAVLGILGCILVVSNGYDSALILFSGITFVGLGNGLTMPSASSAVMYVKRELSATASGLYGAVIIAFGAVFTSITGSVVMAHPQSLTLLYLISAPMIAGLIIAVWVMLRASSLAAKQSAGVD